MGLIGADIVLRLPNCALRAPSVERFLRQDTGTILSGETAVVGFEVEPSGLLLWN